MAKVKDADKEGAAPSLEVAGGKSGDGSAPAQGSGKGIDSLLNVKLDVRIVLGRSRMSISDLLELTKGSVIELDRKVGDPVDIMINDRMVAKGELVKVNGDYLGVALKEIVKDFLPSL